MAKELVLRDEQRLIEVLKCLSKHRREIGRFHRMHLRWQVDKHSLLRDTFASLVSERQGVSFRKCQKAVAAFEEREAEGLFSTLERKIREGAELAYVHKWLFEELCEIPEVGQKIAGTFLKMAVAYLGKWPQLEPYLFVPIDVNVRKVLRDKLKVYEGKFPMQIKREENGQPCADYERFLAFQEELKEVADKAGVHRIFVDELWCIGHIFCKPYPLCNRCWIRKWCQDVPI